jgi:HEAT repeat protein
MRPTLLVSLVLATGLVAPVLAQRPDTVDTLSARLKAPDVADRYAAAEALTDLGPLAAPAVPQLMEALKSTDPELRWRVARSLGAIGPVEAAKEALLTATADEEPLVRGQAIYALGRWGSSDEAARAIFARGLADKDVVVRRAAVQALRRVQLDRKDVLPLVLKLLEDADTSVVMPALYTISEGGAEVVPALIETLAHPEARYWACLVLAEIGPEAKVAVPALTKVLSDERAEVRLQATIALGEIGPGAAPASGALQGLLNDQFPAVRTAAIFALGRIGDRTAAAAIAKADQTDDPFLHAISIWAQAKLNPDDDRLQTAAVALLVKLLGVEDRGLAQVAARALADLGATNQMVERELDKLFENADEEQANRIVRSLASLGPRVVPYAMRSLKHPDRRATALQVLGRLGADAAPAVPNLVELLAIDDPALRAEVLQILGDIGPQAEPAVGAATSALVDPDRNIVLTAAYCVGKIGPPAKAAVPDLRKLLMTEDRVVRLTALWALIQIGPKSEGLVESALPVLTDALKHDRDFVRLQAVIALGDLGPPAEPAMAALEEASRDQSPAVRRAAVEAIRKIR